MNIIYIFDQGLAGLGGKSNPMAPLAASRGGIGSALMLENHLKNINASALATLYCGVEYYLRNKEEVVKKMVAMVKKLNPDYVICGPCFDFAIYALMSCEIALAIKNQTNIKVVAMMAKENQDLIREYANKIPILKMPKKGEVGLDDSFSNLVKYMNASFNTDPNLDRLQKELLY